MIGGMRTALLVLNFGGPQRAGEVESFLYELLYGPADVPMSTEQAQVLKIELAADTVRRL